MRVLASISVCFFLLGCSEEETFVQYPRPNIELNGSASPVTGSALTPVTVRVSVVNSGNLRRICYSGCGYLTPGITYHLYDPYFREVYLSNPLTRPYCADFVEHFYPSKTFEGTFIIDGTIFTAQGDSSAMKPGTYSVIIEFTSWAEENPSGASVLVEQKLLTVGWKSTK